MCQRAMGIWQITMAINLMKEKLKKLKLVTDVSIARPRPILMA